MPFVIVPELSVLDVVGKDAVRIVQNLCTADVVKLDPRQGCEAFITDVRGKTLAHFCVYRTDSGLRLVGAPNQCVSTAEHLDRYTLREDSVPEDRSSDFGGVLIFVDRWDRSPLTHSATRDLQSAPFELTRNGNRVTAELYQVPWIAGSAVLVVAPRPELAVLCEQIAEDGIASATLEDFHDLRIASGFPWFGVDFDSSNLPQEADRDAVAISFTKGCYLGQETVARLDALGQVQKKLVRWDLACDDREALARVSVGAQLQAGEKVVGKLTSISRVIPAVDHESMAVRRALGWARRSHFDAGSRAECVDGDSVAIPATVISAGPLRSRE